MNRRDFIKLASGLGFARTLPVGLPLAFLANRTFAFSPDYNTVNFTAPGVLPQVINIFLYGGPSELAGNLTNIAEIDANSQNSYAAAFGGDILRFTNDAAGGQITRNGFWSAAGGADMEAMLTAGQLSVYRTLVKRKNDTRSHRESIFIGNKGTLAVENSPGVGTRLASLLYTNRGAVESASNVEGPGDTRIPVSSYSGGLVGMPLPFVSFEGESTSYAIDPELSLPLQLRPITLNRDFDNPYSRNATNSTNEAVFNTLINTALAQPGYRGRYGAAVDGFEQRLAMENLIGQLETARDATLPGGVVYPNNGFARNLQAAVTLAIFNPTTLYITAGSDGLGGWDDHNNGVDEYPGRMNGIMASLRAAMDHIGAAHLDAGGYAGGRRTDNIVINVFGDFGRLVNLNNSQGWDHANNQNLYTLGGSAVRPGGASALGKVVGSTLRVGAPGQNNQYTMPTGSSYEAEPLAVASSVYSYFGAQNPEVITADPESNPSGDVPIDETVAGEAPLF